MKPSYKKGIEFIALNEEVDEMNHLVIEGQISVMVLSEAFDVPVSKVAQDVIKYRIKSSITP